MERRFVKSKPYPRRPDKHKIVPILHAQQVFDSGLLLGGRHHYSVQLEVVNPNPTRHTGKYICEANPKYPTEEQIISYPSFAIEMDVNVIAGEYYYTVIKSNKFK